MEPAAEGATPPGAAGGEPSSAAYNTRDDTHGGPVGGGTGRTTGETADMTPDETPDNTPEKNGRTGRNLPAAIAVGLVLAGLVLGTIYTFKVLFLVVVAVAVGIGVSEMAGAVAQRGIKVPTVIVQAGLAAMLAAGYWGGPASLLGVFVMLVLVLLAWRMFQGSDGYVRDASAGVLIAVYPALLAAFVGLLLSPQDGPHRIVVFVAVTVASDIGGYFAGVLFGRHPLAPVISPKKTWEGFAGSAIACMAVGAWLVTWLLHGAIWQGALIGAVVVVLATMGDLIESVIKRDLGIKDLGSVLPGHGGLMDRLDSLVVTLVPVWALLTIFFG
ncbi:hypothetical protein Misp01_00460 [Microtetraspora sp. NBRC 13810]|uniref:phosphatidate cytidylyltransferase n=1 Tax=Microtetraspora sp. NBRC 13810 TaxID=3030990 RepID=UPI0024A323BE|nr:phosphatidate cytidylyltransferase [Microtetraspora sp. NBRC 13810]GLW04916.1 hypothetical protein Misp01_00460 [Microtetraspora sp. NBRC 13810]